MRHTGHKCAGMYEGPLYALDKCSEGQTTLEEAKHLVLIQNAEQGHFADTSVHSTFQRKAIQPGVTFDRVKAESKDMGEVYQKAGSAIVEAPAYYLVWRQALIKSWQSCCCCSPRLRLSH